MSKETGITKQDVTILKAYSSEFDKLPAKMTKFQKTMETTEKLLNEFAQADYTATIFLDDQVTPALDSVSGRLRSFSRNAYKVSVSVDMRKVYTDIYAAERRIRSMQVQPAMAAADIWYHMLVEVLEEQGALWFRLPAMKTFLMVLCRQVMKLQ